MWASLLRFLVLRRGAFLNADLLRLVSRPRLSPPLLWTLSFPFTPRAPLFPDQPGPFFHSLVACACLIGVRQFLRLRESYPRFFLLAFQPPDPFPPAETRPPSHQTLKSDTWLPFQPAPPLSSNGLLPHLIKILLPMGKDWP